MTGDPLKGREVIFEFRPLGNAVRVVAVDVASMTEITIQCPVNTPEALMKSNALKRLEYVLRRQGRGF